MQGGPGEEKIGEKKRNGSKKKSEKEKSSGKSFNPTLQE